jgi:archaellum component FlaF (FlaF/FlaG flagellin family)
MDLQTANEIREWLVFLIDLGILYILVIEYYFDKKIYESKRRNIKRTHNKVVVSVENGQAVIKEQPKDIDVVIENKGE